MLHKMPTFSTLIDNLLLLLSQTTLCYKMARSTLRKKCHNCHLLALALLLVALLPSVVQANSKIAYKKPIFGKSNAINEKYMKLKQENDKHAVEFTKTDAGMHKQIDIKTDTSPKRIEIVQAFNKTKTTAEAEVNTTTVATSNAATTTTTTESDLPVPCTCGVFLSSQIQNGQALGAPLITYEQDRSYACNIIGQRQCQTKCLEKIVQHLPNAANILCATLDRDIRKERAYLFVKNCHNVWRNTNLAAGREYCCKNGKPYTCPFM